MKKMALVLIFVLVITCLSSCKPKLPISFEMDLVATGSEDFTSYNEEFNFTKDNQYTNVINARNEEHLSELISSVQVELPSDICYATNTFLFAYGRKLTSISAVEMNGNGYILEVVFEEEYYEKQVFVYAIPKTNVYPFRWSIYRIKNNERVYWGTTVVDINQRIENSSSKFS